MTTLTNQKVNKCKCKKAHTMLDVLVANDELGKVEYRQKWHNCHYCGRYQIAKWIRLHETRCFYTNKTK